MQTIKQLLKIGVGAIIIGLTVTYIFAWTGPIGDPPTLNISPPITVNNTDQVKVGGLTIGGIFQADDWAIFNNKVGIGTTGPEQSLHVNGKVIIEGGWNALALVKKPSDSGVELKMFEVDRTMLANLWSESAGWPFGITTLDGTHRFTIAGNGDIQIGGSNAQYDPAVLITTGGSVGIGASPSNRLHVTGGSSGQVALFGYNGTFAGTDQAAIGLRYYNGGLESNTAQAQIRAYGTTNYTGNLAFSLMYGGTYPNSLRDVMTITGTDGNVGINTTNPQGALDVVSTTGAFIVPRMTTAQRDALTAVNGMIIYNTITKQFNFREDERWVLK